MPTPRTGPLLREVRAIRARLQEIEELALRAASSEETLRDVLQGTAPAAGEEFLRALVVHLARAADMRYALVSECLEEDASGLRVRTLAFCDDGRVTSGSEWALRGTPCEEVVRGCGCRLHPERLQELFPGDTALADLGAVSYAGAPLVAPSGRVLGHLAVFDVRPLREAERVRSLLELFAVRAAAELERRWLDAERDRVLAQLEAAPLVPHLLPVCAWCRRLRDQAGSWLEMEEYFLRHHDTGFTHGICPECRARVAAS